VAEAFFGRDDRGFHPKTKWHPSLDAADLYSDTPASLVARKTPYFERKRGGFYTINDLWGATPGVESTPVFTDVFERNPVTINGESEKVGMPILYFKADPTKKFRINSTTGLAMDPVTSGDSGEYTKWVYNFNDNLPILQLPWLRDPTDPKESGPIEPHYPDEDNDAINEEPVQVFYELITQREDAATNFYKPHNQSTFLLISAGYDGIYGTKDDLTNFDD
jgi:hypothetical protein